MGRTLGPLQAASVKTTDKDPNGQPVEVFIGRGGELPDNLASGEEERLERAGAFDGPPTPRTMTVPEASVALAGYLPPQVTLAANTDAGTPADIGAALAAPHPVDTEAPKAAGRRSAGQ